jgi:hypothetical protein
MDTLLETGTALTTLGALTLAAAVVLEELAERVIRPPATVTNFGLRAAEGECLLRREEVAGQAAVISPLEARPLPSGSAIFAFESSPAILPEAAARTASRRT